ncbi:uncharacterized protein METZ01_LOCUS388473, partial [marine metagenome]
VKTTGSVDTSVVGEYTLTYTVSDLSSNEATITRKVVVVDEADSTPPVVTLLGEETITIEAGTPFEDPGVRAGDDRDGDLTHAVIFENPLPKAGLVLHLDASSLEGLANGDRLTEWKDRSSNGYTFTAPATAPTYNAKGLRDRPAVSFTGTEALVFTGDAGLSGQPALTTIIVARPEGSGARRFMKLGAVSAGGGKIVSFAQDSSIQYNNGKKVWSGGFKADEANLAVFQVDLSKGYSDGRHWLNSLEAFSDNTILDIDFDSGTEGFAYEDDILGTNQPNRAEGNLDASGGFT